MDGAFLTAFEGINSRNYSPQSDLRFRKISKRAHLMINYVEMGYLLTYAGIKIFQLINISINKEQTICPDKDQSPLLDNQSIGPLKKRVYNKNGRKRQQVKTDLLKEIWICKIHIQ